MIDRPLSQGSFKRNIKLILQYDGTNYAGWQAQNNAATVQELVEKALATVLQEEIRVAGASRTDSGVHALAQVAAFKTSNPFPAKKLFRALNGILPPDVRVAEIAEVDEKFVPRFAREKTYRYAIACGEFLSPFQSRYAWHVHGALDFDAMQAAAEPFIGEHDFTSFTASGGGEKTHVRQIYRVDFGGGGVISTCVDAACLAREGLYHFDIAANGFLYKMVRNIVGTLVEVGRGKIPPREIPKIIEAKDRKLAGPTAPACGLCLVSVRY
ncbi:MAG: tRNA pseudouridine(38-40) synthase TruA [Candidatus Hydrogenedentota bacterium]|nr:MAG: tRNA pseudouridine(38-40) synthase TruA [Candidatus Hydrogenedentota bacterium]